jgi:predicted DNA-binding transcriptional regulator AlpA
MLKLPGDRQNRSGSSVDVQQPTNPKSLSTVPLVLPGLLRRAELAKQLGLSPRTIDRWQALCEGPPRVTVGRTILYSVESVRAWLRSREQQSSPMMNQPRLSRTKRQHKPDT